MSDIIFAPAGADGGGHRGKFPKIRTQFRAGAPLKQGLRFNPCPFPNNVRHRQESMAPTPALPQLYPREGASLGSGQKRGIRLSQSQFKLQDPMPGAARGLNWGLFDRKAGPLPDLWPLTSVTCETRRNSSRHGRRVYWRGGGEERSGAPAAIG